ncbi:MAG: hypothetical protein RSB41_01940 [Bacilli bacterium]
MEKVFDSYKGVVLFYAVVILLSFIFVIRIKDINSTAQRTNHNESVQVKYYA